MNSQLIVLDGIILAHSLPVEVMMEGRFFGNLKVINLSPKVRTYLQMQGMVVA